MSGVLTLQMIEMHFSSRAVEVKANEEKETRQGLLSKPEDPIVNAPETREILELLAEVVSASQTFTRRLHGNDPSSVSLRDITRCLSVMKLFYKLPLPVVGKLPQLARSALLGVCFAYYFRLPNQATREEYLREIVRVCYSASASNLRVSGAQIDELLRKTIGMVTTPLKIPNGVARTPLFLENVFMLLTSIVCLVPIIVVGKPGSSKTLAMTMLRENLQKGVLSKGFADLKFRPLAFGSFQCSSDTRPEAIRILFEQATEEQLKADKSQQPTDFVVFLDEVSLAELSPHRPLKALHQPLETKMVAFAGLSNYELDAAKMNRVVIHRTPNHDRKSLLATAEQILDAQDAPWHLRPFLADVFARAIDVYEYLQDSFTLPVSGSSERIPFYGHRDIYGAVQFLCSHLQDLVSFDRTKWTTTLVNALLRNFGGQPIDRLKLGLQERLKDIPNAAELACDVSMLPFKLMRQNLDDVKRPVAKIEESKAEDKDSNEMKLESQVNRQQVPRHIMVMSYGDSVCSFSSTLRW